MGEGEEEGEEEEVAPRAAAHSSREGRGGVELLLLVIVAVVVAFLVVVSLFFLLPLPLLRFLHHLFLFLLLGLGGLERAVVVVAEHSQPRDRLSKEGGERKKGEYLKERGGRGAKTRRRRREGKTLLENKIKKSKTSSPTSSGLE